MSNTFDADSIVRSPEYQAELAAQRTFMARVYGWMTIGLLATALTALVIGSSEATVRQLFGGGMFWVLIIAQLAIAFGFRAALNVVPVPIAAGMYLLYSVLTGAFLSVLLLIFTRSSIAATFFITAGMFAGISAFGYVTKRSLDSIGAFCMMGLWGLILASLVNLFIGSSGMGWIISFVGVIVFTGLTAYDTQKFKQAYAMHAEGSAAYHKTALLGAFELYLDFINLFIYLLRFMGDRRN